MKPLRNEIWQPIENLSQPQVFHQLDYAVREQVKRHITRHLHNHMDQFIRHGMTFEQLHQMQKELELCPSILDLFPQDKESPLRRGLRMFTHFWRRTKIFLYRF